MVDHKRNLALLSYFGGFRRSNALTVPVLFSFWISHGLSESEIGLVTSIFAIGFVIFEVPSGWLSDKIGSRKLMLSAGSLLLVARALLYLLHIHFPDTFLALPSLVLAEILFATGLCLISGSDTALSRESSEQESLNQQNDSEDINHRATRSWSKIVGINGLVATALALFGSLVAFSTSLETVFYFLLVGYIVGFCITLLIEERPQERRSTNQRSVANSGNSSSIRQFFSRRGSWDLLLLSATVVSVTSLVMYLYEPTLASTGYELDLNRMWVFPLRELLSAIPAFFAARLVERYGFRKVSIAILLYMSAINFLVASTLGSSAILLLLCSELALGTHNAIAPAEAVRLGGESFKATAESIRSLFCRLASALTVAALFPTIEFWGLGTGFAVLAAWLFSVSIVLIASLIFDSETREPVTLTEESDEIMAYELQT